MALAHNPKIITDGLVMYLDAANQKSYQGSGATWTDLSQKGNNGTLINSVAFNAENKGTMSFNGVSEKIIVNSEIYNTDELTVSAFIFPTRSRAQQQGIVQSWKDGSNCWFFDFRDFNRFRLLCRIAGSNSAIDSPSGIIDTDKWHFVSGTYDSEFLKLYHNGELVGTSSRPGGLDNGSRIGYIGEGFSGDMFFEGSIAIVLVYTKCLSDKAIRQNYNALKGRYGL